MSDSLNKVLDDMLNTTREHITLDPIELEPEIARPKSFLKVLDAEHFNWTGEPLRKLFAMRFRVKLPPLDQMNVIYYPKVEYPAPIFIFFCLLTKRKVIGHLNVNCPFDDTEYREQWVTPLQSILGEFDEFSCADRYPEWMKKYRNDSTIYGMFTRDRFDDLAVCARRYLSYYLTRLKATQPEKDPRRLARIETFHAGFIDDIRTQDKAQAMTARMIGKNTAKRIFYEVTT